MMTRRSFRPSLHPLEGRVVLSFSFPKMLHSVFPFIKDTTKSKPDPGAVHRLEVRHAGDHAAVVTPARHATPGVVDPAHTHTHGKAHPQGVHGRVFHAQVR